MPITPNKGFGLSPFGTSPYGFGSPALADPNVGRVYNTSINTQGTGRYINPLTRDYQLDPNTGRLLGITTAQQGVYLALVTLKESSAVNSLGQNFSNIKQISQNVINAITNEVKLALNLLITRKVITLNNVTVQIDENKVARIYVQWTDLSNTELQTTTI